MAGNATGTTVDAEGREVRVSSPDRVIFPATGRTAAMYEADGIKVAHLSYAYGFNGFQRPAGKDWLVNQIDPAASRARTAT